jgi:hypothetical protein
LSAVSRAVSSKRSKRNTTLPLRHAVADWEGLLPVLWWVVSSLLGGLLSAIVFALFLWFAGRYLPGQLNDVSSALSVEDYKNFARLHIDVEGCLTVYPVGLAQVPRRWTINPDSAPQAPWFTPEDGESLSPALIEPPLVFDPKQGGWSAKL